MNINEVEINWEHQDGVTFVNPVGRIDTNNAAEFEKVLESGLNPSDQKVILDFEQVTFISSAGLRAIIAVAKQLRNRGSKLALCSFTAMVERVITVSGFDQVLGVFPSRADATKSFDE